MGAIQIYHEIQHERELQSLPHAHTSGQLEVVSLLLSMLVNRDYDNSRIVRYPG